MNYRLPGLIAALCAVGPMVAQTPDSAQLAKEYTRLEDALQVLNNPISPDNLNELRNQGLRVKW